MMGFPIKRIFGKILFMKQESLVDLFEIYDKTLDKVCIDLGVNETPPWIERWYFRFIQINPIFRYYPYYEHIKEYWNPDDDPKGIYKNEVDNLYEKGIKKYHPEFTKALLDLGFCRYMFFCDTTLQSSLFKWWYVARIYTHFPDSISVEKFSFSNKELGPDKYHGDVEPFSKWLEINSDSLFRMYLKSKDIDVYNFYGFNEYLNKEVLLSKFEKITSSLQIKEPGLVKKLKIPEKTIKDCYRLIEYKAFNPEVNDLIKIAKESGILKLSVGGLANSLDSVDSVRSGVSRLFRLSNQIQEATCNGEFPSASNPDSIIGLYKKMVSEFYLSSPHEIFQYVRSTLPDKKDMYDVIRLEVLEAQG